ncbi:MAG: LamG-like jellyroll fold domain-containing protein [Myxococcota bacterium]
MTPHISRIACHAAALAALALTFGGCTSFFPLADADSTDGGETSVDGTADGGDLDVALPETDGDAADVAPDADGGTDGDGDAGDGEVATPDGDVTTDGEIGDGSDSDASDDGDGDADSETTDADAETGPDVPLCVDPCPKLGDTRCAKLPVGTPVTLEVCSDPKGDGCLKWVVGDACPKDLCQGPATCSAGVCGFDTTKAVTCPPSGNPCTDVVCTPATGLCAFAPREEGEVCDDKDPCTTFTNCDAAGKCVGPFDPVACDCNFDPDCAPKEDGNACNGTLVCTNHACVVNPSTVVTCQAPTNPCRQSVCSPATGACIVSDKAEDTPCDDSNACTMFDGCQSGACVGQDPVICDLGPCMTAACAPASGECSGTPVINCCGNDVVETGEVCDDGNDIVADGCEPDCKPSTCVKRSMDMAEGGVIVPGAGLLTTHLPSTLDFWLFVPSGSAGGTLFRRPNVPAGSDLDWRVTSTPNGDGVQVAWIESKAGGGDATADGPVVTAGVWHHLAVVREPAGGTPGVSWYLDGGPSTVTQITGMQDLGSTAELWIGSRVGGDDPFDGQMDDVRISSFARFAGPFAPPMAAVTTDPQTEAIYHFDDVLAGVAVDASGKKRHGAWQGARLADGDAFKEKAAGPRCDAAYCARGAVTFTGSPTGGVATTAVGLDGVQTMTVEFFIRPGSNPSAAFVMGRDAGIAGMADWHIELRPTATTGAHQIVWVEGRGTGVDYENAAPTTISESTWVHVAAVRDYFSPDLATVRWFIGGKAETPKLIGSPLPLSTTEPLRLASGPLPAPAPYVGSLDELVITSSVKYGGNFVVPQKLDATGTTVALFRFDVGTGGYAYSQVAPAVGPILMPVVTWDPQGATPLTPCAP